MPGRTPDQSSKGGLKRRQQQRWTEAMSTVKVDRSDVNSKGSTGEHHRTKRKPSSFCTGKADGLYANPSDCNKFYQCYHSGTTADKSCPSGLHFNPAIKVCDWPRNVKCSPVTTSTMAPTTASTTTETSTSTEAPTTTQAPAPTTIQTKAPTAAPTSVQTNVPTTSAPC
ncbi:chondroitin proteoglycan 2 [Elysia marginata]|uniref:Chondroitin proteoglycan 2 n=1 Tax=Elysia marginata TaxID=1093978 RepID=A0AAV4J339_9GAST|nr:chondroitin proteoglycan 2 [Elysia marginata]